MGNQDSKVDKEKRVSERQLQVLYQIELGRVGKQMHGQNQYIVRELSFTSLVSMNQTLASITHLQANPHPNMISLLCIEQDTSTNMCGSEFRLKLVFEYSSFSLYDEITARKECSQPKHFDLADICRIMVGCVRALGRVEEQIKNSDGLNQEGLYHRLFVNPERLLIMPDAVVKLISPLIVSPYDRYRHKNNCYYSPEKLTDFDYPEDVKSSIFELGVTFIHILTLQSCQDIYNGFEVKQDQIDKKILRIWQIYHNTLICEIISKMTRIFRNFRVTLKQCLDYVDLLESSLENQLLWPSINQICLDASQSPLDYLKIGRQKGGISKLPDLKDKQNVINSSNRIDLCLEWDYDLKVTPPLLQYEESSNEKMRNNAGNCHQSYMVTNQAPFVIEMVTSVGQEGKQSYCYGKQLSEGIIKGQRQAIKFERKRTRFNKKRERTNPKVESELQIGWNR